MTTEKQAFDIYSAHYNARSLAECLNVAMFAESEGAKAYHMERAKEHFAKLCKAMGKAE